MIAALTIVAANLRLHIREREAQLAADQREIDEMLSRHGTAHGVFRLIIEDGMIPRLAAARATLPKKTQYSRQTIALLRATCRPLSRIPAGRDPIES